MNTQNNTNAQPAGQSPSCAPTPGSHADEYAALVDKYQSALDALDEEEAKSLLLPLLMKRAVDGGNGRVWDASEHRKWEQRVQLLTGAHGLHAFK